MEKEMVLMTIIIAIISLVSLAPSTSAEIVVEGLQEYYVLGNESGALLDAYATIDLYNGSGNPPYWSSGAMHGAVSIVAWENNTKISVYKDEMGYALWNETTLDRGDIVTFQRDDLGGDRIVADGAISVIRTAWRDDPGTFSAGTWELFPVNMWNKRYSVPITQRFTELIVQAAENDTHVTVTYPNGTEVSVTLDKGEDHHFPNATRGTVINADKKIQAGLITSNDTDNRLTWYGIRYYALTPVDMLGNDYYIPVPSFSEYHTKNPRAPEGYTPPQTRLWIYAVENCTVHIEDGTGYNHTVYLGEGEVYSDYFMPNVTGVYKKTSNTLILPGNATHVHATGKIWVVGVCDEYDGNYDWGFQALNVSWLDDEYYIPWSPANPVYVTPVEDNTQFHVDFDLDSVSDLDFTLNRLQLYIIYPRESESYSLTGARIWTDDGKKFAIQWGQDNNEDTPGERGSCTGDYCPPDKDFGYTVLPIKRFKPANVAGYVYEDRNCNCRYDDEPGVEGVTVGLYRYMGELLNETKTNGDGFYIFTNLSAGTYVVRYDRSELPAHLDPKCDDDGGDATEGTVTVKEGDTALHNFSVNSSADIDIVKLINGTKMHSAQRGEIVEITLNITNTGRVNITDLVVVDELPSGLSWADSAVPGEDSVVGNKVTWSSEVLQPGESFVIRFLAEVAQDASGTLVNTANVTGESDWGNVSDDDNASVRVILLGTVDGYVYEDRNCNCRYDDEPGVSDIDVTLFNGTSEVKTTKTDEKGYYKFTDVPGGYYWVSYDVEDLPSYLSPKCDDDSPEGSVDITKSKEFFVPGGGTHTHNFAVKTAPSIELIKLVEGGKHVLVAPNETVTFTLIITNNGPVNLTDIVVTDVLPNGLSWANDAVPKEDSVTFKPDGTTEIVWSSNLPSLLKPGDSFKITFNATVNSDAEPGKVYENHAIVNASSDWGDVGPVKDNALIRYETHERVPVLSPVGIVMMSAILAALALIALISRRRS